MLLKGKQKMMCLISVGNSRTVCLIEEGGVSPRCTDGYQPLWVYQSTQLVQNHSFCWNKAKDHSLSKPNQKVEKGRTLHVPGPAKTNKLLVNSGQANNFGVNSSTTQQKWHPNNKVQTSLFFLRTYWSSFLWSWSRYLFLPGKQAPGTKSVTEINLNNSAWSSIQHLLVRNAMDITTLHKSFQTKTHLFYSTTKWRCGNMSFTEWYNKQNRMSIHPSFVIHVFKKLGHNIPFLLRSSQQPPITS